MDSSGKKPLVFVAEDSRFFLSVVRWGVVDRLGFDMVHATTLVEARQILAERADEIYVALLDLNLPDAPNGEVIDLVARYHIPSVVFTGSFTDEIREFILSKGVVDYIPKDTPQGIETVLDLIRRLGQNSHCGILVVDDSRVSRELLRRHLHLHRFKVYEAGDGAQALQMIEQHPDLVMAIIDYNMPGMNGCELTRRIRAKRSRESFVIVGLSAYGNNVVSANFMKSGANDYINKPFVVEELFCRIYQNLSQVETIAALKRNEAAMAAAMAESRAASDAKTHFLSQMSHELRTPLNAVIGFSQLLMADRGAPLDDNQTLRVQKILHAGEHLLELVNDALDIARVEAGRANLDETELTLEELLPAVQEMAGELADKRGVTLALTPLAPVRLRADRRRLLQIALNLVSNAVKFTPAGGRVVMETGLTPPTHPCPGAPMIRVSDSGPGMDEAGIRAAFEPFGQSGASSQRQQGSGLGIPVSKAMAEAHGGDLTLESTPGHGTIATLWLAPQRRVDGSPEHQG